MYAEVSSGIARERGEEQGCKYTVQKSHEKVTMTKKGHIRIFGKKVNDRSKIYDE